MKHAASLLAFLLLAACGAPEGAGAPTRRAASERASERTERSMPFAIDRLIEGFEGRATEVLQVSGYTYVAVASAPDEVRWVVSLRKEIDEGAHVRVRSFGKKSGFVSKQLGRTFEVLWFGIVTKGEDQ